MKLTPEQFAKYFDHTILKADATKETILKVCDECIENGFKMIAINSSPVKLCKEKLAGTGVNVGAAISFPLGQTTIDVKAFETKTAIEEGCDEIDYVINLREVKAKNWAYIQKEMETIVEICRTANVTSKVIYETCYLSDEEVIEISKIAKVVKPDFVKTSTGFGTDGSKVHHVKLMKSIVQNDVKVKASGGVRDLETALAMIAAGVERIGSSSSVKILEDYKNYYNQLT